MWLQIDFLSINLWINRFILAALTYITLQWNILKLHELIFWALGGRKKLEI